MLLEEAQARLKKEKITSQDQLWAINSLYILLDLHKDDFCKIIDAVGLETLMKKQPHYDRLDRAEQELSAKERYISARARLEEIEAERAALEQVVNTYRPIPTA
jgi:hypothetical protein